MTSFIAPVHIGCVFVFIILGGFLASLNHTRYDIVFPVFPAVYQVWWRHELGVR